MLHIDLLSINLQENVILIASHQLYLMFFNVFTDLLSQERGKGTSVPRTYNQRIRYVLFRAHLIDVLGSNYE